MCDSPWSQARRERGPYVGVQLSRPAGSSRRRRAGSPLKRVALGLVAGAALLLVSGCSAEDKYQLTHWAMPEVDATDRSGYIYELWKWGWVAALVTGAIVWALMFYAMARYRRRSDDEIPVQTRYNLPLEIFYTFVPIVMVVVFFAHTVKTQNAVLEPVDNPDHVVEVVGQQWSWTFNYTNEDVANGRNVYESGTGSYVPTLVLPEGESVQFNLRSPDVIHSFWITGFLMKMDVIPGKVNRFWLTPTKQGTYRGKCAELCGVYHSRMLFNVKVVSPERYDQYLQQQIDRGFVSDEPVLGNEFTTTQPGLESGENQGGQE